MPIDFRALTGIQPGAIIAQLPSSGGGESDGGIGELLSGIQGLAGAFGGSSGGSSSASQPVQASTPTPYTNTQTYSLNSRIQGLQGQQPSQFQSPQQISRDIAKGLNPELQKIMPQFMADLKAQGFEPMIASGFRSQAEQAEKVRQGYSKTMHSQHTTGNAIDIVDRRYKWDDKRYPNEIKSFANAMATTAKKYGLKSGTDWKSFGPYGDFAHVHYQGDGHQHQDSKNMSAGPVQASQLTQQPINSRQAAQNNPYQLKNPHQYLDPTLQGIAYVETRDSKNAYNIVGKNTGKQGRAIGKYQIMETNIGPWSKEATGRKISVDEFKSNPQLQDQVAAYKLNEYLQKYGPEDAASMWFSGRPMKRAGNAKDLHGTSVPEYVQVFMKGFRRASDPRYQDFKESSTTSPNPLAGARMTLNNDESLIPGMKRPLPAAPQYPNPRPSLQQAIMPMMAFEPNTTQESLPQDSQNPGQQGIDWSILRELLLQKGQA